MLENEINSIYERLKDLENFKEDIDVDYLRCRISRIEKWFNNAYNLFKDELKKFECPYCGTD